MSFKTDAMLSVTMIHDRTGRRVGSYLVASSVDRPKDSLEGDRKQRQDSLNHEPQDDEAVVFHHSEEPTDKHAPKNASNDQGESSELNLTV
jgi:hypothetical protein